ncbi:MAG: uroporphyrinogen decarboxylase family protein [Nitrospinaceae bacterium]|nr:uroporphyrinogen decarboxylase family protein [Nitrospinaceae bacterium]
MEKKPNAKYNARMKRFDSVVSLKKKPDRVPVIPWNFHFFPSHINGMSNKDAMNDHETYYGYLKDVVLEYDFDMAPASSVYPGPCWEALGLTNWKWPGHGLADDLTFQYLETEVITADEYDQFLENPEVFAARVIFPRTASAFAPLAMLPPIHWYFNHPYLMGPFFGMPQFTEMLDNLKNLGEEWNRHSEVKNGCFAELSELGYPTSYGGVGFTAYDTVSIWLRGNKGAMTDMYRNPDKLLSAIDICAVQQTQLSIIQCQISGNPRLCLFVYRGADGFMTEPHFEKFFWPSFKKQIDDILEAGFMPMPFFEGDWTGRLKYIKQLPKGKFPLHFDRIDRKAAAEALGDDFCFWGNVPVSLMEHGTPQDVEEDVKELIDMFAGKGGVIIDSAGAVTDHSKPENVAAMVEATRKYGK